MPRDLTPDAWRSLLEQKLSARQPKVDLYEAYYAGNHRLSFATSKFKEAFGVLFQEFATNWCGLVVDSPAERLAVQGFRFDTDEADMDAWKIWQANRLDAESLKAHTEAGKCMVSYLSVGPGPNGVPRIRVEHPSQVIVEVDPSDPQTRLAALKRYRDFDGSTVIVLYLPDFTYLWRSDGAAGRVAALGVELPVSTGEQQLVGRTANPLGIVPIVPMANTPGLLDGGVSDLRPAIRLNDAANKFFTDMIVASEYQAFRQRVLSGVEVPRFPEGHPQAGQPMPVPIEMAVSRMLVFEDPNAKAYDLSPGDLGNYVHGVELAVQHIAAQTRTPPHYLLAKMVNLSGDALKAAETGLVAKVRRKQLDFADSWEEAMRLAFKWRSFATGADVTADRRKSEVMDADTIWRDPESRAPGVIADSLVKKQQIGVPWQALMEEAGYGPSEIARLKRLREQEMQDAQLASLFSPDTTNNGTIPSAAPELPVAA